MGISFLKKLGGAIAKGVSIGGAVAAIAAPDKFKPVIAKGLDTLSRVGDVVIQTEALAQSLSGPVAGADKLKAASPIAAAMILESSLVAGRKIADQALFTQGCQKITDGMADILNSIDGSEVPDA